MRVRARILPPLALLAAALITAGCTSGAANPQAQGQSQSQSPSRPATSTAACQAPEPAALPHAAGSLTEADSGAYCLGVGQTLDVFLTAPSNSAPGVRWAQIKIDDTSVVGYGNSGVLTPPVGVTPGVFVGAHPGTATISSTLPSGTTWKATLVVK
jgi:hypothetical protein